MSAFELKIGKFVTSTAFLVVFVTKAWMDYLTISLVVVGDPLILVHCVGFAVCCWVRERGNSNSSCCELGPQGWHWVYQQDYVVKVWATFRCQSKGLEAIC